LGDPNIVNVGGVWQNVSPLPTPIVSAPAPSGGPTVEVPTAPAPSPAPAPAPTGAMSKYYAWRDAGFPLGGYGGFGYTPKLGVPAQGSTVIPTYWKFYPGLGYEPMAVPLGGWGGSGVQGGGGVETLHIGGEVPSGFSPFMTGGLFGGGAGGAMGSGFGSGPRLL
jgi:hypothetical protein